MSQRTVASFSLLVTALLLLTGLLFAVPPAEAQTKTLRGQLERETARGAYPLRNVRVTLKTTFVRCLHQ